MLEKISYTMRKKIPDFKKDKIPGPGHYKY
jgi:hypothetical protein